MKALRDILTTVMLWQHGHSTHESAMACVAAIIKEWEQGRGK